MERQIRLQIKALKAVQEVYDETKIPTIHKLTKVVQERILREKGEYIAGIEEQAQYLHEIFDQFLDEAEVLSPHRGAEKSKEAKKNKAKADESFGRDTKPFDIDQTGDDDFGIAALKQTKKARKNTLNLVQRQKLSKKRIKTALWIFFLKRMVLNYIFIFHAVMNSTPEDMSKVLLTVNHSELIAEGRYFLTEAHMYLKPWQLDNVEEDWNALFAIYKSYIFNYAMNKV